MSKGTFAERVKRLTAQLRLKSVMVEPFESVIGIGNAAAHRATRPEDDQLSDLLDLVEEIIKAVYVTPKEQVELHKLPAQKAAKLKLAAPPRLKTRKKDAAKDI